MTPLEIQIELKKRNVSQSAVARAIGVHFSVVGKVIRGEAKSRRVATTIANVLSRSVDDIWPGKYPTAYQRQALAGMQHAVLKAAARMAEKQLAANSDSAKTAA